MPGRCLDGVYPADGIHWTKFSAGTLSSHMYDMAAFAHARAPLERRWDAGGAAAVISTRPHHAIVLCALGWNLGGC